jgi:SNF2 family DNA or RNA helicase
MGQVRDVLVYRLLADETVDERIMEILKTKQNLFDNFADESVVGEESLKPDEQDWIANMVAEEKKRLLASGAGSTQEDTAGVQ